MAATVAVHWVGGIVHVNFSQKLIKRIIIQYLPTNLTKKLVELE